MSATQEMHDRVADLEARRMARRPRPTITVSGRQGYEIVDETLRELKTANDPPVLFMRGRKVARIAYEGRRDPVHGEYQVPVAEAVGKHEMRERMSRVCDFIRIDSKERPHAILPPTDVATLILATPRLPFPALAGLVEAPFVRPDGSICTAEGYDAASGLYLVPAPGQEVPEVPDEPTGKQVEAARDMLMQDLLADFPFEGEADRAGALALLLTPILRALISGATPIAVVDATRAGTGKGLLVSCAAIIATGRPAAAMPIPHSEEEWRKTLMAEALRGRPILFMDEAHELGSASLASYVAESRVTDRILGVSEMAEVPLSVTWAAAGNNVRLLGDMPRRCYRIRLDAKMDRPWERPSGSFRHPALLEWAQQHRARLLGACLTLARAWVVAGRPAGSAELGGFGGWARVLGGVLETVGVSDFLTNTVAMYEQSADADNDWAAFLAAWSDEFGPQAITCSSVERAVRRNSQGAFAESLPPELGEALDKGGRSFTTKLGMALKRRRGTRYGGLRVEAGGKGGEGANLATWRVVAE
jgi:hypothetical protein